MNTYKNITGQITYTMEQICNKQLTTLTALCFGKKKIKAKIMQIPFPKKLQNRRLSAALQLTRPTKIHTPETRSETSISPLTYHSTQAIKRVPHKVGNVLQLNKNLDP